MYYHFFLKVHWMTITQHPHIYEIPVSNLIVLDFFQNFYQFPPYPDPTAIHSFLSSYSKKPAVGHMKVAQYALHYIHSTNVYGSSFSSEVMALLHSYIHHLH